MWPYGPETSLCLLILIQPIATMNPMDESPLLGEGFSALDGAGDRERREAAVARAIRRAGAQYGATLGNLQKGNRFGNAEFATPSKRQQRMNYHSSLEQG
jgi:hypothetical protein